jgi:hypothetical protein
VYTLQYPTKSLFPGKLNIYKLREFGENYAIITIINNNITIIFGARGSVVG